MITRPGLFLGTDQWLVIFKAQKQMHTVSHANLANMRF